jgi:hypothetical protein
MAVSTIVPGPSSGRIAAATPARAEVGGRGAGFHLGGQRRVARLKPQPARLQRLQRRAARHHAEVAAGLRQPHADPAADGAGAVDADFLDHDL